jgi:hypothetical protein
MVEKGVRDIEHALEVDADDVLPILDHRFRRRGEGIAPVDAGVVHQDRDLADPRADLGGDAAARHALGHIEPHARGRAPAVADDPLGLSRRGGVDVENDDVRTLPGIADGYCSADARSAAGDSGDVALKQPAHVCPRPLSRIPNAHRMNR